MSDAETDLDQVANDIRWMSERLKGFIAAGDALKGLGSIRNAIAEKTKINDDLVKQIDAHKATIADFEKQIAGLNSEHAAISAELATVQKAHQQAAALLGGVLKQIAPQP